MNRSEQSLISSLAVELGVEHSTLPKRKSTTHETHVSNARLNEHCPHLVVRHQRKNDVPGGCGCAKREKLWPLLRSRELLLAYCCWHLLFLLTVQHFVPANYHCSFFFGPEASPN